jgi:Tol biopolymer transport system component
LAARGGSCQARLARRAAALVVLASACVADDALRLPPAPESGLPSPLRHLTFNLSPDVSPVWSNDGRSISYVAQDLPPAIGLFLRYRIPAEGGIAVEELRTHRTASAALEPLPVQRAPRGPLVAIAFLSVAPPDCPCSSEPWPGARLLTVAVLDTSGPALPISALPQVGLALAGWSEGDTSVGSPARRPLFRVRQTSVFNRRNLDYAAAFGPSWAPDCQRLAISDGRRIIMWNVVTGELDTVPGVDEAAFPRWSPDGRRLAFTRYRDSLLTRFCALPANGDTTCFASHETAVPLGSEVWLVQPNGEGLTLVAEGEEAAWLPSGDALIVRRGGLVLVDLATGAEQPIENTEGATEPAVSPDGRRVAFVARFSGNQDLWIAELPPRP